MTTLRRLRRGARRESIGVDVAGAVAVVASITKYLSLALLVPAAVALGYSEPVWPWIVTALGGFAAAWAVEATMPSAERVGVREGFLIVSLTWLVAAAISAVAYALTTEDVLSRPVDAYFESMSGFTTTGASVVTRPGELPHSVQLWRQLSQWVGGMGIIVLAVAVLPRLRVGGRQLLESELPGPEIEELTTRVRDTARRLWLVYVALTVAAALVLGAYAWTGIDDELGTFEAVAHALTTIPTGGFSTETTSVAAFGAVTQWTLVAFMILGGANFALMYRALIRRRIGVVARDEEFRVYIALLAVGAAVLVAELIRDGVLAGEAAVRHSVFQTVSIMTTTGFATVDFNTWPLLALVVMIGLMFLGGSAGSTSGSVKVVRHLLLGKMLYRELDQTVHPELISRVRLNRTPVDERTVRAIVSFILIYIGLFIVGTLLIVADAERVGFDLRLVDAVGAAASTLGNVGPAFGPAGPVGSYEPFSDFSKLVMTALMWLGRLEILPIVVLFTRQYWRA